MLTFAYEALAALSTLDLDARTIATQVLLDLLLCHFARAPIRSARSHPLGRHLKALERALIYAITDALEVQMVDELAVRVNLALGLRWLGSRVLS